MCANNEQSLHVSYLDLSQAAPSLGIWLADCPAEMLKLFNQEAYEVAILSEHLVLSYIFQTSNSDTDFYCPNYCFIGFQLHGSIERWRLDCHCF